MPLEVQDRRSQASLLSRLDPTRRPALVGKKPVARRQSLHFSIYTRVVRFGAGETRHVSEIPDQAPKDEHDAKEAEDRWEDPQWVEELYQLWDRYLLQKDPSQAVKLTPEQRRAGWDAAYALVMGIDTRSAESRAE